MISIALKILILTRMERMQHAMTKKKKSKRRVIETDWGLLKHVREKSVRERKIHPII